MSRSPLALLSVLLLVLCHIPCADGTVDCRVRDSALHQCVATDGAPAASAEVVVACGTCIGCVPVFVTAEEWHGWYLLLERIQC